LWPKVFEFLPSSLGSPISFFSNRFVLIKTNQDTRILQF
jgi:hypothetical protein